MKYHVIAAIACGLMLSGCSSSSSDNALTSPSGKWQLSEMVDYQLTPNATATLEIQEDGQLSGSSGCNRYFGQAKINKNAIELSPVGATRMACEENIMNQENAYMNAMSKVVSWQGKDGKLILNDPNGKAVLIFKPE